MILIAPGTLVAGCIGGWYLFKTRKNLLIYIGLYVATASLFYFERLGGDGLFVTGHILKYALMGMLIAYSMKSKKLSLWIFSSMIIGVEVGLDFPEMSLELKRFGDIFLRLIKTLVAPLLFSTLVVGIAGHSSLKQVGRMGLKSIIYFEIVTTFALFLGLAAINISQAGKGVQQVEVSEKLKDMKISEEKAKMVLEAMKNQEVQYLQQNKRKATKPRAKGKPDW